MLPLLYYEGTNGEERVVTEVDVADRYEELPRKFILLRDTLASMKSLNKPLCRKFHLLSSSL